MQNKVILYWRAPSWLDAVRPPSSAWILKCWALGRTNFRKREALTLTVFRRNMVEGRSTVICPFRTDPLGLFAHNPHTSWQFDCPMVAVQFTDGFVSDDGCDGIYVVLVSVWRLCLFFLVIYWWLACTRHEKVRTISVLTFPWARLVAFEWLSLRMI
jgi:hypothetical protein